MAKNGGILTVIGKILGLIAGILSIVYGVLSIVGTTVYALEDAFNLVPSGSEAAGGILSSIILILVGLVLLFIYIGRIKLDDLLVLGIVILVLGLLGGGLLAIFGGILIIVDKFV